ncbi:MAG: P-type conjugative transfer protein TrbG, partial [Bradyrhizobium sp.]|nr:P-type conjugative transfer protein TrbG [Bradyrhizobium sp.]
MTPALRKAAPWSAGLPALLIHVVPVFRKSALPGILLAGSALAGCATHTPPPEISYDNAVPAVQTSDPPAPVRVVELPKPLPLPGQLKPIGKDGKPEPEPSDPAAR